MASRWSFVPKDFLQYFWRVFPLPLQVATAFCNPSGTFRWTHQVPASFLIRYGILRIKKLPAFATTSGQEKPMIALCYWIIRTSEDIGAP